MGNGQNAIRVAIYNRWLPTLGGGERLTLDLARALVARGDRVELLTHAPIELPAIERRFNLDLVDVTVRVVPDSPGNERMTDVSAAYDLLINVSQGDLFRSAAGRSWLVVHFPQPLASYASGGASWPDRRWAPSRVTWLDGVYGVENNGSQRWAWSGRRARIMIERRWPTPAATLLLRSAPILPPGVAPHVRVLVDGAPIAVRSDAWTTWRVPLPGRIFPFQRHVVELEVDPWTLRERGLAPDDRERGLPLQAVALLGARLEERLVEPWIAFQPTAHSRADVQHALDSYDLIAANSQFTQRWIARRWGRSSQVLYPAVDIQPITDAAKQPIVLSVGRFFPGQHNKKHLPMIHAFRDLCSGGLRGWEYHLVGGCDLDQPDQRAYLEAVQRAADGYPIMFHVNAPVHELHQLYRDASIFWHATGYGEDEDRDPETTEHFGITTIEAMVAGCVPIVVAKGGQPEIVTPGSGLPWRTLPELQAHTRRVIDDPQLRSDLSAGAIERSHAFSFEVFCERVRELSSE